MPSGLGFLRLVKTAALRSLTAVSLAQACLSRFHLPIPLRSTGITPLLHYYEDSDASRLRLFAPLSEMNSASLSGSRSPLHVTPTSNRPIPNHPTPPLRCTCWKTSRAAEVALPFTDRLSVWGFVFH
jgi:hypothetical protein